MSCFNGSTGAEITTKALANTPGYRQSKGGCGGCALQRYSNTGSIAEDLQVAAGIKQESGLL